MDFIPLSVSDDNGIRVMSVMAAEIVREHFDPIIGKEQNDYMIQKFQTADSIRQQLKNGSQYYFVLEQEKRIGFMAFYPKDRAMYLSKFYLYKNERGKGYAVQMMDFVIGAARDAGLESVDLNVNRNNSAVNVYENLGFSVIRTEKKDIGSGFYMDDYVFSLKI